jgi:SPP1 gp7 family putative phage head morphogenesis protein
MNARLSPKKKAEISRKNENRRKNPKKPVKRLEPTGIQRRYAKMLLDDLKLIKRLVNDHIKDELAKINQRFDSARFDDELIDFLARTFKFIWRLYMASSSPRGKTGQEGLRSHYESIAQKIADQTNDFNSIQFGAEYKRTLGVDPLKAEPFLRRELDGFVEENISRISELNETYLSKIQQEVIVGFRKGEGSGTIAKRISDVTKVTESRARLIARDQVSKLNTGLEQLRAINNGVTRYIWHTNIDGRERPSHREVNGKEFTWASGGPPAGSKGEHVHPGQDIQCRCYAENIYEDLQGI